MAIKWLGSAWILVEHVGCSIHWCDTSEIKCSACTLVKSISIAFFCWPHIWTSFPYASLASLSTYLLVVFNQLLVGPGLGAKHTHPPPPPPRNSIQLQPTLLYALHDLTLRVGWMKETAPTMKFNLHWIENRRLMTSYPWRFCYSGTKVKSTLGWILLLGLYG